MAGQTIRFWLQAADQNLRPAFLFLAVPASALWPQAKLPCPLSLCQPHATEALAPAAAVLSVPSHREALFSRGGQALLVQLKLLPATRQMQKEGCETPRGLRHLSAAFKGWAVNQGSIQCPLLLVLSSCMGWAALSCSALPRLMQ